MFDTPIWLEWIAFSLSAAGALSVFILSAFSALRDGFDFFPPPSKQSWQHKTFLALFRLYLYPLIALTVLVINPGGGVLAWVLLSIGALLILVGFGLAFRITLQMGWRNAFGEKRGLMTSGWFAVSRNPIYVATWLGLIGWALVASDMRVAFLLTLWALMYLFAPYFEEPWLEREYGDEYLEYKQRVRRFL